MEASVEYLKSLLATYLSDDGESDDESFEHEYEEEDPPPPLLNRAWDADSRDHILLQNNDPKLASLAIGEGDSFFPGISLGDTPQWGTTGTYLGNHGYLNELRLGHLGGVGKHEFQDMCKGLARNMSITRLKLCSASIFDRGHLFSLIPFLQKNGNLRHLSLVPEEESLRHIDLGPKGILMLAVALSRFRSLATIELVDLCGGEELDDELSPHIFDALSSHPELSSINLYGTSLGGNGSAALSKLNVDDGNMGATIPGPALNDTVDQLRNLGPLGRSPDRPTKAPTCAFPAKVQPGILCEVNGLKSEGGQKLNGRRCAVLRFAEEEGRYEVRMENEDGKDKTFALKAANLAILPKLALPTHSSRGSDSRPESLCELLLYYKGSGPYSDPLFSPSEITFTGFAASSLDQIDDSNLQWLVAVQLEQMGGVLGLASICEESEKRAESVLFALLEGAQMYVDVLIQTIHWTGLIDHESMDEKYSDFNDCPPTKLTPDQDSKPYIRFMSKGPFRLLFEMARYKFGNALWAALNESEFYHLLIQRLMRVVARESLGTRDGIKLGPLVRKILLRVLPGIQLKRPLKGQSTADNLLRRTGEWLGPDAVITADTINAMFLKNSY